MIEKAAFVWSVNDAWAALAAVALLAVLLVPFAWDDRSHDKPEV